MDPAYRVSGDQASYFGLGAMPEGPRDGEPGPSPSARGYWGTLLASLVGSGALPSFLFRVRGKAGRAERGENEGPDLQNILRFIIRLS